MAIEREKRKGEKRFMETSEIYSRKQNHSISSKLETNSSFGLGTGSSEMKVVAKGGNGGGCCCCCCCCCCGGSSDLEK